jgi:ankyrin repeat protein
MKNSSGDTLLISAVRAGNTKVVKKLINKGADIKRTDKDWNTVLMLAVEYGHIGLTRFFTDRINPCKLNKKNKTITDIARKTPENKHKSEIIKYTQIAYRGICHNDGTALIDAVIEQEKKLAELLLKRKISATKKNEYGWAAIHYAAQSCNKKIIKLFSDLDKSIINLKNKEGYTPLMLAAEIICMEGVRLLSPKTDICLKNSSRENALAVSVQTGNRDIIDYVTNLHDMQECNKKIHTFMQEEYRYLYDLAKSEYCSSEPEHCIETIQTALPFPDICEVYSYDTTVKKFIEKIYTNADNADNHIVADYFENFKQYNKCD